MLVIATQRGYFKRIREPGDQFEYPIKKDDPMPSWMIAAKDAKSAKAADRSEAAEEAAQKANETLKRAEEEAEATAEAAEAAREEAAKSKAEEDEDGADPLDITGESVPEE